MGLSRKRALSNALKHQEYHFSIPFNFNGFFEEKELIEEIFKKMVEIAGEKEFSKFRVAVSWPKKPKLDEVTKDHLKYAIQRVLNIELSEKLGKTIDFYNPDAIFLIDFNNNELFMRLEPVYVVGRYCKFSRKIAQTEYFCNKCRGKGCWYCKDTGHFSEESVEELLEKIIVPHFGAKAMILHGAGREDLDVLMLGKGRPFIAQIISPQKRLVNLREIEEKINEELKEKISVNSLQYSNEKEVAPLKNNPHDKIYLAKVAYYGEIDLIKIPIGKELVVKQGTPQRVEKRRAILEREKKVTIIGADLIQCKNNCESERKFFNLTVQTSHGTYVKEFISSDNGRTKPSISSILGVQCFCEQLDVLEIID